MISPIVIEEIAVPSIAYDQSLVLRNETLRKPLGLSLFDENLSDEENQVHLVALLEAEVVGVVVMLLFSDHVKLRQMAVLDTFRGKGIGASLLRSFENKTRSIGIEIIRLHARQYARGFYEKLGYSSTGRKAFEEVGIPHVEMEKILKGI